MLLCAIGLLLTVAVVPAFGYDVANDVVGFGLVLVGALRIDRGRSVWWTLAALGAAAASFVRLFTYGGLASSLTEASLTMWSVAAYLSVATEGVVTVALLVALATDGRARRFRIAALTMAATFAAATGVRLALEAAGVAYLGPTGFVHDGVLVVLGLLSLATLVLVFLAVPAHRHGAPDS